MARAESAQAERKARLDLPWRQENTGTIMRGSFFWGMVVGAGGTLVASIPWETTRPAAKRALRAGLAGYAAVRGAAARFAEDVEDLVAEVAHEMKQTPAPEAASATAATQGAASQEKDAVDGSQSKS
ncbi:MULTISPECIES: DUF5132 domain-containing protein [Sphingomonadales]|nr:MULTISPECIES: DUF5132 domain-containing protein [Sphingomonadaceae]